MHICVPYLSRLRSAFLAAQAVHRVVLQSGASIACWAHTKAQQNHLAGFNFCNLPFPFFMTKGSKWEKKSPNRCSPFPKLTSVAATRESDEWGPHTHPKSVAIFSKVCLAPWENMPHRCIITRFCLVEMQEQRERSSSSFLYQLFLAAFSLIFLLLQFRGSCKNNRRAEGKGGISSEQHFFQQSNLLCLSSLLLRFSQKRECIL